jgi:hypothetical protein
MFVPQDLTLKDDAVHKTRGIGQVETWYYDAFFENGYSMVTLINYLRILKIGVVITSLFIYKDGVLIKSIRNQNSSKYFYGSLEKPFLKLKEKELIKCTVDKNTNNWIFYLNIGNNDVGAELKLERNARSWIGKTYLGSWIVIPKFKVNGRISLNNKKIVVSGEGYHDHNIYPVYAPLINKGYSFGKIRTGEIDITWAQVIKNQNKKESIVVINNKDEIISIPSKYIDFKIDNHIKDHRKIVPTKYHLTINYEKVDLDVTIESINFHHLSVPTVNYWRHHVKNIGKIKINSTVNEIENIEIAEQLIFL